MTTKDLIVRVEELETFTTPKTEGVYESQSIIDRNIVGSQDLNVNRGVLKVGQRLHGGSHPVGSDECYYVLRGKARLALGGDYETGDGAKVHEIGPDTAIFIPGGTFHALDNPYDEDLVILTIWPHHPKPGDNSIYDERIAAWGTSFRKKASPA
ncbi:MAG: cupin domain-containing protein [Chloroflexi bacterium]|nr:cupin domain-containing protein [Chloroflexota bacterium]MCL5109456.1 cupin domain-containing protein [Chloroflexota bacterium]